MYKNILKFDISRLRKLEVRLLANRVITTVEGYNPVTLKIKEVYDLLVEQEPQIEFLDVGYGPHPISPNLSGMRRKRRAIGQGIVDQIRSIENGKMIGTDNDIEVAKRSVTRYLQGIWKKDDVTIHEKVDLFFLHFDKSEEQQTAFESLSLVGYLDSLRSVNNAIEEQYNSRRKSVSERPKAATHGIVTDLKTGLGYLFKQIEVAQIKNPLIDYTSLIDDLNEEILLTKAKLKTRASNYKKKAEGVIDDNEVVIENQSGENSEPIEPAARMYPMSARMDNEDYSGEVDIKRTVAVSTKQKPLPDISTEV